MASLQIESIAMDGDAEDGLGSISGVDAMNVNASEQGPTQATQQSQSSQAGLFYKVLKQAEQCRFVSKAKESAARTFLYLLPVFCFLYLASSRGGSAFEPANKKLFQNVPPILSLRRRSSSNGFLCTSSVNHFVSLPVRCESRHHI